MLWAKRDYTLNSGPYEQMYLDFTAVGPWATIFLEMWQNFPVEFNANAINLVELQQGGAVTSTECTATHAFPTPGTYTVCLTVTDSDGASDTTCTEIEITNRPPTCAVTYAPAQPEPDQTMAFDCNAADPDGTVASATWTFGDGGTDTGLTVTHSYAAPGLYAAVCTVADDLGAETVCGTSVTVWWPAEAASHALDAGWHLLSLPLKPVDPDPAVVFAGIPISGSLYRYDPVPRGYVMYHDADPAAFGEVDLGMGMWLHLDAAATVSYQGHRAPAAVGVPVSVSGWHLIGAPQPAPVPLTDCTVWLGPQFLTLEQAVAQGWIWTPFYWYDESGGGYARLAFDPWSDDDSLRPWRGYWCRTGEDGVTLGVPAP